MQCHRVAEHSSKIRTRHSDYSIVALIYLHNVPIDEMKEFKYAWQTNVLYYFNVLFRVTCETWHKCFAVPSLEGLFENIDNQNVCFLFFMRIQTQWTIISDTREFLIPRYYTTKPEASRHSRAWFSYKNYEAVSRSHRLEPPRQPAYDVWRRT